MVILVYLLLQTNKMNIKSSLVVLSVTAILVSAANVRAQEATPSIQSFEQWCQQKDTLPEETKRTVEILLRQTRTQDCKAANLRLNSLKELSLNTSPRTGFFISDVQPLASLTNLTFLSLYGNGISDVQPLANLTNLTVLYLDGNQISDVQPLASLTNLTDLSLGSSQIRSNQIIDVQPLVGLTNLTYLRLDGNGISDVQPLASLTNLTELYLDNNQISDVKPLASLTNLTYLDLRENATLTNRICPVRPESICIF
jgi:internalin A